MHKVETRIHAKKLVDRTLYFSIFQQFWNSHEKVAPFPVWMKQQSDDEVKKTFKVGKVQFILIQNELEWNFTFREISPFSSRKYCTCSNNFNSILCIIYRFKRQQQEVNSWLDFSTSLDLLGSSLSYSNSLSHKFSYSTFTSRFFATTTTLLCAFLTFDSRSRPLLPRFHIPNNMGNYYLRFNFLYSVLPLLLLLL